MKGEKIFVSSAAHLSLMLSYARQVNNYEQPIFWFIKIFSPFLNVISFGFRADEFSVQQLRDQCVHLGLAEMILF